MTAATAFWLTLAVLAETASSQPLFVEAAAASGLNFRYQTGARGSWYFPEIMGGGAALFDFDSDGDLDIFFVQAQPLGEPPVAGSGDRLFRNDLGRDDQGRLVAHFVDVTPREGFTVPGYGMGVAVGDIDADGDPDLFLSRFGTDRLLVNLGDGRFEDRSELLGEPQPGWSTSATFADYNHDGWLDLYITRYVELSLSHHPNCYAESTRRDYCGPSSFQPAADRLLKNRRGQGFEDVSAAVGLSAAPQPGLGVISGDFDGDGRFDFFVANDGKENQLWLGQADGKFHDEALLAGVALDRQGKPQGSMGVDAGDFDRDGDFDLFVTNLAAEFHALYVDEGGGLFAERSVETGLAAPGLPFTGFGTVWLDADLDGRLDLFAANGAVRLLEDRRLTGEPFPFGERNQLFLQADRGFVEHREAALEDVEVSRGLAAGDVEGDGDTDLLVVNAEGPPRLLAGTTGSGGAWIGVVSAPASTAASRVVIAQGKQRWVKVPHTDGSYLSASSPHLLFGLGDAAGELSLRLEAGDGGIHRWRGLRRGIYVVPPEGWR